MKKFMSILDVILIVVTILCTVSGIIFSLFIARTAIDIFLGVAITVFGIFSFLFEINMRG